MNLEALRSGRTWIRSKEKRPSLGAQPMNVFNEEKQFTYTYEQVAASGKGGVRWVWGKMFLRLVSVCPDVPIPRIRATFLLNQCPSLVWKTW